MQSLCACLLFHHGKENGNAVILQYTRQKIFTTWGGGAMQSHAAAHQRAEPIALLHGLRVTVICEWASLR